MDESVRSEEARGLKKQSARFHYLVAVHKYGRHPDRAPPVAAVRRASERSGRSSFQCSAHHSKYSTPLRPRNAVSPVRNLIPIFRDKEYPRASA